MHRALISGALLLFVVQACGSEDDCADDASCAAQGAGGVTGKSCPIVIVPGDPCAASAELVCNGPWGDCVCNGHLSQAIYQFHCVGGEWHASSGSACPACPPASIPDATDAPEESLEPTVDGAPE